MKMRAFGGPYIVQSPLATKLQPLRMHKKRYWQTDRKHALIQKKWTKRWGQKSVPCCYQITDPATGERTIVVHPEIAKTLTVRLKPTYPNTWERMF